MFKAFPSASVLFILIGLECLWMLPAGSAEAERSAPSRPRWSDGHFRRLAARPSAGGSAAAARRGGDLSQGEMVRRMTTGLDGGVCSFEVARVDSKHVFS